MITERELKLLESLTSKEKGPNGHGTGYLKPGFTLHEACLIGSYPYLLHYKFTAVG